MHPAWYLAMGVGAVALAVTAAALVTAFVVAHRVPRLSFRGKTVLLTGGSAGIGLALAEELLRKGAAVMIAARRQAVLDDAVAALRKAVPDAAVACCTMDVGDEASVAAGVAQCEAWAKQQPGASGRVDVLICNAGFSHPSRFLDIPADVGRRMMDVNLFGCVNACRAVLPAMQRAKAGRIVLVASQAGLAPVAGFTLYAASKAAVRAFAASLDMENGPLGVNVQVLNPPDVATPGYEEENKVKSEECRRICAMGGVTPWTPGQLARDAVGQMEHYRFQINFGFDGWLLGSVTAGMDPAARPLQLFAEYLGMGLFRLVSAVYSMLHYGIVRTVRKEEGAFR